MSALSAVDWDHAQGSAPECDRCRDARAELDRAVIGLAKANHVLRLIRRIELRAEKPDGIEDDPIQLTVIGYASQIARIHARIDLYLAARGKS
jgi:hypothetical protein